MNRAISIIFFLTWKLMVLGQMEQDIYELTIHKYALSMIEYNQIKFLLMPEKPFMMPNLTVDHFTYLKKEYPKLDQSTFSSFLENSSQSLHLDTLNSINIPVFKVQISEAKDWKQIALIYPSWSGLVFEFSNVGYNEALDQAMLYYAYYFVEGAAGGGVYLLYKKKREKWKFKKQFRSWAI